MRRTGARERTARTFPVGLSACMFLWVILSGCDHYCVSFFSNESAGTVSVNNPTCSLNTATNGMIRVRSSASPAMGATWGTLGVQHIFIRVRGVEVRPSPVGNEGLSDWLELAPRLAEKPTQIDLMAAKEDPAILVEEGPVPSGGYAEVRLLLDQDSLVTDELSPEDSSCRRVGFNCVVTTDGNVRPLILSGEKAQIVIPSTRIPDGMFHVLADTRTNLDLEFSAESSVALAAPGRSVWLDPVFAVHSEFEPDSRETTNRSLR